jgi:hypothetical protein
MKLNQKSYAEAEAFYDEILVDFLEQRNKNAKQS